MRPEVIEQLLELNRQFYDEFAAAFSDSRQRPQPGFSRLLPWIPTPCHRFLDVGCGDGRLGRFLQERATIESYMGVDFSVELLAEARATTRGEFRQRDLSRPGSLDRLGRFEAIACLAVLQHIPGRANRLQLLQEMAAHLAPGGRLFLATWQFKESPRQQRKLRSWSEVGLTPRDVDEQDYLLSWRREGFGYRYVALIDAAEVAALARAARLTILEQFRSDGKEGNLSLYTILTSQSNP